MRALVTLAGALALTAVNAGPSFAATINVTTTVDEWDVGKAGTGLGCSLREALRSASAPGVDHGTGCAEGTNQVDVVELEPGATYPLTISGDPLLGLESGDLDLNAQLRLVGDAGDPPEIDGQFAFDRIFDLGPEADVEISGVRLAKAATDGDGGAIESQGDLVLADSEVVGNEAGRSGGGILSTGTLAVRDSSIAMNEADSAGGGIAASGGSARIEDSVVSQNSTESGDAIGAGIAATGTEISIVRSEISENESQGDAGGIHVTLGYLIPHMGEDLIGELFEIRDSTVEGNTAAGFAGGLHYFSAFGEFTASVRSSTFTGNRATTSGGIRTAPDSRRLEIVNSTISANSARNSAGGLGVAGEARLNNVTITANVANSDGNQTGKGGGVSTASGARLELFNSVVSGNRDQSPEAPAHDCAVGPINVLVHSLIGVLGGCEVEIASRNLAAGTAPGLAALADNGGPTLTHALLDGSPLIGAGHPSIAGTDPSACAETDQRGVLRQDCEIGAWESELAPPGADPDPDPGDDPDPGGDPDPDADLEISISLDRAAYKARAGKKLTLAYTISVPGKVKAVLKGAAKKTRRFKSLKKNRDHGEASSFRLSFALKSKPKKRPQAKRRPLPKGPYRLKLRLTAADGAQDTARAAVRVKAKRRSRG